MKHHSRTLLLPIYNILYVHLKYFQFISFVNTYRLLTINDTAIDLYPSIAKMRVLYNNYELDSMVNEYLTPMERNEENDFVDSVLATPLMRQTMLFLQEKGKQLNILYVISYITFFN